MIFFTADTHFGHRNIIDFCLRPYPGVAEMEEGLIEGINSMVGMKDELYHLGDFGLHLRGEDVKRLRGRIKCKNVYLIRGNHDDGKLGQYFQGDFNMHTVRWNHRSFLLCHYPLRSWRATYQLHGHEHGNMKPYVGQMDVGVDGPDKKWRGKPWSIEEVIEYVNQRDTEKIVRDACKQKHGDRLIVGGYGEVQQLPKGMGAEAGVKADGGVAE